MTDLIAALFGDDWLPRAGVSVMRTSGLMLFLPIFGAAVLARKARLWITMALALVMVPMIPALDPIPEGLAAWAMVGFHEVSVGVCLGITAKVLFAAYELAAQLVSGQSGFSLANMVDPVTGGQSMAPALLMSVLASALFLAADLHHLFIHALHSSYEIVPPAAVLPAFDGLAQVPSRLGIRMFTVAIELAAPAMVIAFAMDLLIALVGRAMTKVPIILVAYPAKMALAVVGLGLLVYATGSSIRWVGRAFAADGATILAALAGR